MRAPRWHALALLLSGCLSTPPGSLTPGDDASVIDAGVCASADWADAAPPSTPDAVGNVLSLDFEEPDEAYTFRDRSGWRRDAARLSGATTTGQHGNALVSGPTSFALVADDGFELGRNLTIAAWVYLQQSGASAVFTDYDGISAGYDLHIDSSGRLVFLTTGAGGDKSIVGSPLITAGTTWFHVAVTWSGDTVTLYVNGAKDASLGTFVDPPLVHKMPFTIGRRPDDGAKLVGLIDDVRVWNRALSLVEIDAFMQEGDLAQRCGDGVLQLVESCERGDPCCSDCVQGNEGCTAGCGDDGVCVTGCGRPTRGLVALYRFDEGDGAMVHDASNVDPPLDLALEPAASYRWTSDGLELTGAAASSMETAAKILDAVGASGEFTFDVWLTPGNQLDYELVRVVSLESGARDLILGIWNASYVGRFGVDTVDPLSDQPALESFDRVRLGDKTHLVLTRSADGTRRFYVDGILRDESRAPGDLAWGDSQLLIGDAPSGGRNFVGTLHRVAIHSVALDAVEVAASFHAGPRP